MEEPKAPVSVRVIPLKEYTNTMRLPNKINFSSLLIKISLIPGRAVRNLQSMSLLGIRSRLPSISYAFQFITFLKYGGTVIKRNGSEIARKVP